MKIKDIPKAIKKWSTRKTTLWYAVFGMTLYAIIDVLYTLITSNYLDSTLTTSWFDAMRWICGMGGGITIAEIVKGEVKG